MRHSTARSPASNGSFTPTHSRPRRRFTGVGALAALPHVVPAGQTERLCDYGEYLRRARAELSRLLSGFQAGESAWEVSFPLDDYAEDRIDVVRELEDGDAVVLGGYELEAVATSGHADPHLAFFHEDSRTLLSGDPVDPDGRFQYGPLLGDVGEYKRSLRRVRDLDPDVLVPMHGPPLEDPGTRIEASLENAAQTEERILAFVDERGPCHAREFVTRELGVDGTRSPFLTLVTYEYSRHLEERGLLDVEVTDEGIRLA